MTEHWQPSPLHSGKLIRLKNLLTHLRGYNALILEHNQPLYRDNLIDWLGNDYPDQTLLDIKDYPDFIEFEHCLEQQAPDNRFLQLINLESLSDEQRQAFYRGLNYHREHVAATASNTTLLFWLPEPMIKELALHAPDFWAWREQVIDFSVEHETQPRWEANYQNTTGLDVERKHKRITEIQDYLSDREKSNSGLIQADILHELGNLYETLGEYSEAKSALAKAMVIYRELDEKHAYARVMSDQAYLSFLQGKPAKALTDLQTKVLPWFKKLADCKEQAETQGRIADILQAHGQFDEALHLRQEEELPIYEQLGDVRSKAVTMGKIADIMQARGQLDEALRIRREESLPVYEQLGDVRSKAVTMGKIADIMQARGQLDEALRIRREESLPVYEQLGDVYSKAVTMGKIADIMQARGQLDEALRIRREEELPAYEQLGDVREKAITMGYIADIMQAHGQLDEALRLRQEEELSIYEELGDIREKALVKWKIAIILWQKNKNKNRTKVKELLNQSKNAFQKMGLPEADAVQKYLDVYGLN